jgi:cysteine sulfinate desulfinase/cysteine desulfurase-like protein
MQQMERQIYLDNSATTRVDDAVFELMKTAFLSDYGNPSSMHVMGINSNAYAEKAGRQLAASLGCEPKNFIYTSCGTESDNLAIIGGALANARTGKHIITTAVEHPAVTESVKRLTEYGFEISYLSTTDLAFRCHCSKERIGGVLSGLDRKDLDSLIEDGQAEVVCHFCGEKYQFDKGELQAIADAGQKN